MDLKARVDVNCEWKDGRTDERTDGRKTGHLCRTLLKQVRQKWYQVGGDHSYENYNMIAASQNVGGGFGL